MSAIRIPTEKCPKCGNAVQVQREQRGEWLTCPYCNQTVQFGITSSPPKSTGLKISLTGKQIVACVAVALIVVIYMDINGHSLRSVTEPVVNNWNKLWKPSKPVRIVSKPQATEAPPQPTEDPAKVSSREADYDRGVAYARGEGVPKDMVEAAKWFRKAADQGDVDAQHQLGRQYSTGNGVPQDDAEAVKWFRKAADQGDSDSQYTLGLRYATSDGVPKDEVAAAKWFRKAADQGNADAQSLLGSFYATGSGVPQDDYEAVEWYRKAAEQGDADAQFELGMAYKKGVGITEVLGNGITSRLGRNVTEKNTREGFVWLLKAGEQGHAKAQHKLALCYSNGEGTPEDEGKAVKWARAAAVQGYAEAQILLGLAHAIGSEVTKNPIEAYKWFILAHSSGEKDIDKDINEKMKAFIRDYGTLLTPWQRGEAQRLAKEFKPVKAGATQK